MKANENIGIYKNALAFGKKQLRIVDKKAHLAADYKAYFKFPVPVRGNILPKVFFYVGIINRERKSGTFVGVILAMFFAHLNFGKSFQHSFALIVC